MLSGSSAPMLTTVRSSISRCISLTLVSLALRFSVWTHRHPFFAPKIMTRYTTKTTGAMETDSLGMTPYYAQKCTCGHERWDHLSDSHGRCRGGDRCTCQFFYQPGKVADSTESE